ncbi:hypothetical protein ACQP2K_23060 [Microbispora siamensis]
MATEEVIRAALDLLPDPGRSITSIAKKELRVGAVPRQLEAPTA